MRGLAPLLLIVRRLIPFSQPSLAGVLLGGLLAAMSLALARPVSAQQFRINGLVERERPFHRNMQFRYWISEADCLADDKFQFNLTVDRLLPDDRFQVWAGTKNCSQPAERQRDSDYCWLVYEDRFVNLNQSVLIEARDIVARQTPRDVGNAVSEGTANDCREQVFSAKTPLYFMYVNINDEVIGQALVWDEIGVDTQGPSAPTELRAAPADDGLSLNWKASPSGEVRSHRFYCAELGETSEVAPPAATGITDGGEPNPAPDEETDAAPRGSGSDAAAPNVTPVAPASDCSSPLLTPGEKPPEAARCGSIDTGNATSGRAKGLVNGRRYAVGVAAVDELGNTGALSNLACNTPEEVIDFWDRYREAGGRGGGGFCSFGAATRPSLATYGSGLLLLLSVLRRRKRS